MMKMKPVLQCVSKFTQTHQNHWFPKKTIWPLLDDFKAHPFYTLHIRHALFNLFLFLSCHVHLAQNHHHFCSLVNETLYIAWSLIELWNLFSIQYLSLLLLEDHVTYSDSKLASSQLHCHRFNIQSLGSIGFYICINMYKLQLCPKPV